MKIIITGAAGFIGFSLIQHIVNHDIEIIGLDNINDYYDVNLKHARLNETGINTDDLSYNIIVQSKKYINYRFIKLNIEDKNNIETLFKCEKIDIVCNLAAQAGVRYSIENPFSYIQSNIVGFTNILECCRNFKIKHLIYASSSSVYGNNEKTPFNEEDRSDNPISLYAATKKANELMAYSYSHLYSIKTTGLRFFTVYGPWGRPDMAPMLFADAILNKKPIRVYNNGNMKRDFTYIDDIVSGILKIIKNNNLEFKNNNYEILNIGNSKQVELIDFIKKMENCIGEKAILNMYPLQPGDVNSTFSDISKIQKMYGYQPKINLDKGLNIFVNWYKEYYNNNL